MTDYNKNPEFRLMLMKILIVDDQHSNRELLKKMLVEKWKVLVAENGQQAVELFAQESPDLILMDIFMPLMNGIEAIRLIRDMDTEKWIPIIVLSALVDEENIVAGLNAGADDYLTKPLNKVILHAKLNTMQHFIVMQEKLLSANKELTQYQQKNEIELAFTKEIFDHLITYKDQDINAIDYWILPSRRFSGDLISVKRISPECLYFVVADVTGHGLAASLPTIIVNQVFQAMTRKQSLVSSIVKEINHKLRVDLPIGRFVALTVGMLNIRNKSMDIWNGGLPELMVINDKGEMIHCFKSKHIFAGVLADSEFEEKTERWRWTEPCELFVYTDGVTDVFDNDDNRFGCQRLLETLKQHKPGERIMSLKNRVLEFMHKELEQDDVSCLAIRCD